MKKIGIIGAMDIEVAGLKEAMQDCRITKRAGMEFCSGLLCGKEAVVVQSGIGKVNAAMCTQILADLFGVDCVINTGIAGSLNAAINIGDIVISTDAVQHDVDVTAFGYEKGQVPRLGTYAVEADRELAELAEQGCRKVNPQIGTFRGRVVSGDQFVASKETKKELAGLFEGSCTEMEGASIAQAAWLNGIPFVILRAISDKADDSAQMDYDEFERQAAQHCIRLVKGMLAELA